MNRRATLWGVFIVIIGIAIFASGCGKKIVNQNNDRPAKAEPSFTLVADPVPNTKLFALSLTDGVLNYSAIQLAAGDAVKITLQYEGAPVDFKFEEPDVYSTDAAYFMKTNPYHPGGAYHLACAKQDCGSMMVIIENPNPSVDSTVQNGITRVAVQKVPLGVPFSPGMALQESTVFSNGDQMGISISGAFDEGASYAYQLFDPNGTAIAERSPSYPLKTGDNGSCCFALPTAAGSYALKFYMNDTEIKTAIIDIQQ
ncbi:MAG: hypothetical protein PHY34_03685 [Patescibacteria group bacterium]|nr:hypothetical protein [Patescibacteria group bacterium]MDD5716007.1 hypothetical protein [Patescibacteria group bacterium]